MNEKDEKKSIKKELKKKKRIRINFSWIITITLTAFAISFFFSFIAESFIPKVNLQVSCIMLLLFILIGIFFDIIGVAIQTADEKPFHSMSARKIKGAKTAIKFKKNAEKVSSFCNDVIGDICGVISGTIGSMISLSISSALGCDRFLVMLIVTAFISALTIGGKAIGKSFAVNQSNEIIYHFARIISIFQKNK